MDYDDYRPRSTLTLNKSGHRVVRSLHVRAASELDALYADGVPAYGDMLDVGTGSDAYYVFVSNIDINQVEDAAGADGLFLFEVTVIWTLPTRDNPVANHAVARISARPRGITILNVEKAEDQTHYGGSGSGEACYTGTGINVTEDGPQGTEFEDDDIVLTVDHYMDPSAVTAYLATLNGLLRKVNSSAFSGIWGTWAAGEARYRGYDVTYVSGEVTQVSHEIVYSPNETLDVYLDSLKSTVEIVKKGWEYVWKRMIRRTDPDEDTKTEMQSVDAHKATYYRSADFSVLNLPSDLSWG